VIFRNLFAFATKVWRSIFCEHNSIKSIPQKLARIFNSPAVQINYSIETDLCFLFIDAKKAPINSCEIGFYQTFSQLISVDSIHCFFSYLSEEVF